ncbi:TAM domain methyltransferase [Colletotrichum graminicola M1.001]|uniref:TAM domain methyltransferase n=1 Tax=Colletotrichum graminicola (strain M1.001 / M2 / FGSC 10212) TaxID=645133 RepID=E3Q9I7_COLGM|nr:TAM domain methyltransferase [Colletotrichum graminicola M1.001]EFQ27366.1 TAM domain methyltransferase [Colletotrichum graminicola M1.001]
MSDEATPAASTRLATYSSSGRSRSKDTRSIFQSIFHKFVKTGKRFGFVPNSKSFNIKSLLNFSTADSTWPRSSSPERPSMLVPGQDYGLWNTASSFRTFDAVDTNLGFFAFSLAKNNPNCAVMGIDIEKVRPPYSVPNCQFKLMDVTADWTIDKHFDYIHVRMLGDIVDKEKLIQSIYDHLNPGGWVEFSEWIAILHSPNHSLDGSATQKWNALLDQGLRNMGRNIGYVNEYPSLLEKAGFERLKLTKHAAPTNACYPGKKCQRFGAMMANNWNAIIEPLTIPIFTIGLGWPESEVHVLVKKVRKEIPDPHYHSFMTMMTVYCRKPRLGASSSASLASSSRSAQASASQASFSNFSSQS